jgi:putative phage-type endonuclease
MIDTTQSTWTQNTQLVQAESGPIPSVNREVWLEARKGSIGASESGAVCGRSKWAQPYDVWAQKTGRRGPIEETSAMRLGTYLEPYVIGEYVRQVGLNMLYVNTDMPILRHKKYDWLTATPDALVSVPDETPYLIEAKVVRGLVSDEWGTPYALCNDSDVMPDHYFYQVQHQLLVSGLLRCDLVVLFVVTGEVRVYRIDRAFDAVQEITAKTQALWRLVEANEPPDFIFGHDTTPGGMVDEHRRGDYDSDLFDSGDGVLDDIASYYPRASKEYKQMGDHLTVLRQKMMDRMEAHDKVKTRGGYVLSRSVSKETPITEADVTEYQKRIGEPKRKSSISLRIKEPK